MPSFDPPSIKPDAAPDFTDSSGCAKWLQSLPLINIASSHVRLLAQLDELNAYNIAPGERLKILELLRGPVSFVQKEHSKKFSSRPAPLAKPEREILESVHALWDALSYGYQHCLKAIAGGASATNAALIGERVLWCTGQRMLASYQAYQDVGEREWKLLHSVYAFAEDRGVAGGEVAHPTHKGSETTCTETYAQILLIDLANPGKLTPRQIELISLWLERWTPKVSIGRAPAAGEGIAPLVVDLSGAAGASRRTPEGDTTRVVDIQELGSSVRKRVGLLRKGETPAALGLGEDVTAPLAESLLTMLYRRWCEDKQSRAHPRRGASGTAQICSGMAAVHYFVTGRAFAVRGGPQKISQVQHEQIATLGRVSTVREDEPGPPADFAVETWQIRDESASGLRLARVDASASSRLMLGQLLGIRLADAKAFLLCAVKWLSVSVEFELRTGVHILPGIPQGAAIRPSGAQAAAEQYTQAFLLPAVAALQAPETLVVPAGWFKPNREIEVLAERSGKLRLASLVDRGADFERVTFEAL
jgi:cyclic-di-GMP-binding protein